LAFGSGDQYELPRVVTRNTAPLPLFFESNASSKAAFATVSDVITPYCWVTNSIMGRARFRKSGVSKKLGANAHTLMLLFACRRAKDLVK